jgi:hypothetical protein
MSWFYNDEGTANGPFDEPSMMGLITAGKVHATTLIWNGGIELWQEAGTLSPTWWQPAEGLTKTAETTGTSKMASARRSPVPLAPSEAPKKTKAKGLLKRLFGSKDASD